MKTCDIEGTEWHLTDEGLVDILKGMTGPGEARRGYVTCTYGDGTVFIKSFTEKGIPGFVRNRVLPRGKKEYLAGVRLTSFHIATPKPLGYGISRTGSSIIQEWIGGVSFSRMLKEGDRRELMRGLARLLKEMKTHGVRHNDLHLDNILVKDRDLYLIDLHKMKIKRSFGTGDEVSNLSHALVSVYHDMDEDGKDEFFTAYGTGAVRPAVEREIGKLTARWFRKKRQRAFEGTSKITVSANRLYVAGMEGRALGDFAGVMKQDKKVKVERYGDHIRKIYRDKRRLRKAWKAHVIFLYMNLPAVPAPYYMAMPAKGQPGFIAMEDLGSRGEELDRYLDRNYDAMSYAERRRFIDRLALFFEAFLRWGIMHHDLKGCNLFVLENRDFRLLDVEDFTFGGLTSDYLKKMFLQLATTLPKRITMRDRMRFYARITAFLNVDRKALFRLLLYKTAGKEIIYEGKSGLVTESW
jgi:tRNA A-37 threonylcarbamoyl transferase component Bud32